MTRSKPNTPTTTVGTVNGNINNVEESTMSDKTGTNVIILRGDNYDAKATKIVPEAGIEQTFPDDNAGTVFATRVTAEVLKAHKEAYAFMVIDGGVMTLDAMTTNDDPIMSATVVLSSAAPAKKAPTVKKRPIAATKPPVKKAAAKKTVAATKAPAVRKRPTPPAAPAAPARKTAPAKKAAAPAKKAAPAAPRKTVAAAPAKAPARKTAPPAKKAPARKTAPSKK